MLARISNTRIIRNHQDSEILIRIWMESLPGFEENSYQYEEALLTNAYHDSEAILIRTLTAS